MSNALPYRTVPMPEAGTPEWLELRKPYIGASESAAACGVSEWATRQHLYHVKSGLVKFEGNRATRAGNAMEAFIRSEFELETGKRGFKPQYMCVSNEYPWMACNIDWLNNDLTEGADFKNSGAVAKWGEEDTDEVPLDYFFQCQHDMVVIPTLQVVYLYVLLPFYKTKTFTITPDKEVQSKIIEATRDFHGMLQAGIEPPLDINHQAALDEVKARYNTVEKEKCIVLPEALSLTVENLESVKAQIKSLELTRDGLQATILEHIGDAGSAEIKGRYTFKRSLVQKKPYLCNPKPYTTLSISPYKKDKK